MKKTSTLLAKTFTSLVLASATLCLAKEPNTRAKVLSLPLVFANTPLLLYTLFVEKYQYISRKYKLLSVLSMVLELCFLASFYTVSPSWAVVFHVLLLLAFNAYFLYERKMDVYTARKLMYYDTGRCIAPYVNGKTLILYSGELVTILERQGNMLLVRKFNGDEHWVNSEYIDENCPVQD
eukprot:jgi/Antlo1/1227/1796